MENYRNICKCVVERLAGRSFLYVSFVFLQFKIRLRPRLASGCSKCSSRQHDGVHSCNFNACTCRGGLHVFSRVSREGDTQVLRYSLSFYSRECKHLLAQHAHIIIIIVEYNRVLLIFIVWTDLGLYSCSDDRLFRQSSVNIFQLFSPSRRQILSIGVCSAGFSALGGCPEILGEQVGAAWRGHWKVARREAPPQAEIVRGICPSPCWCA